MKEIKPIEVIKHKKLRWHRRVYIDPCDNKRKSFMVIHKKDFEMVVGKINEIIVKKLF